MVWDGDIRAVEKWGHCGSILGSRENWLMALYGEWESNRKKGIAIRGDGAE